MLRWTLEPFRSLFEPWFPVLCLGCNRFGASPCSECLERFAPAHVIGEVEALSFVAGLVSYDDVSRPFIADLKYGGKWSTARTFAPALAALLDELVGCDLPGPTLTWAPTTPQRARERGFDQAEVLAREVGRVARRPVRRLLVRRPGHRQTGRSRRERASGIDFVAREEVSGAVVVVDDVVTTGATLCAAARTLRAAGASEVVGLALAATPMRSSG